MSHFIEVLGIPYLVCLTMVGILGHLGIHVLKREVIFIDIALAQVVAVGAIAAHLLFGVHGNSLGAYTFALGSAVVAAGFYAVVRRKIIQIPLEAVIGISYAIAAAAALFLVGIAPGGHVHIHKMLAGSMLWADWKDLLLCIVIFGATGLCFYFFRRPFEKISEDYEGALSERMKVVWWDFLFYSLLGLVITIAVSIGGVVVVFALLIIPATLSAIFSSRWSARLFITWTTAAAASLAGLLFAYTLDFSIGPSVAAFLGVALVLAALTRILHRKLAVALTGLAVFGFVILIVLGHSNQQSEKAREAVSVPASTRDTDKAATPAPALHPVEFPSPEDIADMKDCAEIERVFKKAADAEMASALVCRALELNPKIGTRLAIVFLKDNPPFFFCQQVISKLNDIMDEPVEFDPEESFGSDNNKKAIAKLKNLLGLQ